MIVLYAIALACGRATIGYVTFVEGSAADRTLLKTATRRPPPLGMSSTDVSGHLFRFQSWGGRIVCCLPSAPLKPRARLVLINTRRLPCPGRCGDQEVASNCSHVALPPLFGSPNKLAQRDKVLRLSRNTTASPRELCCESGAVWLSVARRALRDIRFDKCSLYRSDSYDSIAAYAAFLLISTICAHFPYLSMEEVG